jgi:hypothetical protein
MLRKTKVSNLDMTVIGEENVFWFEVAVYDVVCMEVVEGHGHFCSIELSHWVRKSLERKTKDMSSQVDRNSADGRFTPP